MKDWTRLQRSTVGVSCLYVALFLYMLVARPGTKAFYHAFFNTYQILPPLFASVCGLVAYRFARHGSSAQRIGWVLIALAALSFAAGQSTWTYYESIRGIEVPFPGWADVGYLGNYPLLILGVVLLFGSMPVAGRARQLLDNAIAAGSAGVLSWYFLIQHLWQKSDVLLLGKIISIAYPLGDVAALFGAVMLLSSTGANRARRRSWLLLAIGIVLFTFFDTSFTWMSLRGTYETGSWSDWSLSFGWLLIAYSFLMEIWWQPEEACSGPEISLSQVQVRSVRQLIMPYLAVAGALGIVGWQDYSQQHTLASSSIVSGMLLLGLVIIRQVLMLLENRTLTLKLKAFNDNLERMVAQRTEQLTALHDLVKAVTTTMQPDELLATALAHTQRALRADAIILWLVDEASADPCEDMCGTVKQHVGFEGRPEMLDFLSGQPVHGFVDTVSLTTLPQTQERALGACLRAPLAWQNNVAGMIGVIRWDADFGATECQLMESIGLEVGTALQNARLYSAAVEAADIDSVTGLYNHRAMHQRLERTLEMAKRQQKPFSIVMMDLNNFKLFNDTYGHPVGDEVLKRVAQTLREVCRDEDILGRYGGDEFILVLPHTHADGATTLSQRLRAAIDAMGFRRPNDDRVIPVALSCGIASYPDDSANRHELLTIADANLYLAKQTSDGVAATSETQRANRELRGESSFAMLDALVTAVDNKDRYTRRHSEDVTEYAIWIAEEMRLSEETLRQVRIGGLLHDVGKIGVPDEILRKPGRLTPEEYEVLKRHPWIGALIVSAVPGMEGIVDAVRFHHERWDGQGYPDQLQGNEIPLLGRIMAVADAFSAMTTDRPYRRGLEWKVALDEIRANKGTQFDPSIADVFLRAAPRRRHLPIPEPAVVPEEPAKAA